jgi:hypothetical protein
LEAAAEGEGRDSSLTKSRVEEVIERVGGEQAERAREEYRRRQATAPRPWYAPLTLSLTRAFSRELLRDESGDVRGDTERLEGTVAPVMRDRYRLLSDSFVKELVARERSRTDDRTSIFNLNFRTERQNMAQMPQLTLAAPPARDGKTGGDGGDGRDGDDALGSLPVWARDFIKRSYEAADAPGESIAAIQPSRARRGAADAGAMTTWTAPGRKTAPMELRRAAERPPEGARQQGARVTDADIRRMADKVYNIIESRVSTERRRLGY